LPLDTCGGNGWARQTIPLKSCDGKSNLDSSQTIAVTQIKYLEIYEPDIVNLSVQRVLHEANQKFIRFDSP